MTSAAWRASSWVALGVLALGLAAFSGTEPRIPAPPRLTPGVPLKASLAQGQTRLYAFSVKQGDLIDIAIRQWEAEATLALRDSRGDEWQIDKPLPDQILALAETTGEMVLFVSLADKAAGPGRFELTLQRTQTPSEEQKALAEASRALLEGDRLRLADRQDQLEASVHSYQWLLAVAQRSGQQELQALAEYRLGSSMEKLARRREALHHYRVARNIYIRMGRWRMVADLWSTIGDVSLGIGDLRTALAAYQRCFELNERLPGRIARSSAAGALANIALSQSGLGEVGDALRADEEALQRYAGLGGHIEQRSTILVNLANLNLGIGQPKEAQKRIQQVEELLRGAEDPGVRARVLSNLAGYFDEQGQAKEGIAAARQALDLCRRTGDRHTESYTLIRLARCLMKNGQLDEANAALVKAVSLARQNQDPRTEGQALANQGITLALKGSEQAGLELLDQSLLLFERIDNLNSLSLALFEKAKILYGLGRLAEADQTIKRALETSEELRSRARDRTVKVSLAAKRRSHVDLQVELLMALAEQHGDPDLKVKAFEASESARARTLFEDLVESQISNAADGAHEPRILKIGELLEDRMRQWQSLQIALAQNDDPGEVQADLADLEQQMKDLVAERDHLRSLRREAVTGPMNLPWRRPLSLGEIQRSVLSPDAVLLSYALGPNRSFVWVVTPTSIESYALPPGPEIDDLVRQARRYLDKPHDWDGKRANPILRKLSAALIEPVRGDIVGKTLLISPDGALRRLPFALLSDSPAGDRPLIEDHAIVTIPSASILASLQSSRRGRARAPNVAAILADPIFTLEDERVRSARSEARSGGFVPDLLASIIGPDLSGQRGARSLVSLARLDYSGQEGEEILRLAPPGFSRLARGSEASLELVRSKELGTYQYLHFATHGLLNSEPELSSLVLSQYNEEGVKLEGVLPAYEISQLDLPVEIVVLSACETGLTEENGQEEVSGLARAFLYAGARRVVASLWNVDDRATTELMKYFYNALWREGLSPAQALRKAQREMRKTEEFSAPVYWAGFVLQGEE